MKNKGIIAVVTLCMFFSLVITGCQPVKPTISKMNEIPAWGNKIYFDWSLLPKGEKGSFYAWSEPFIYKMLSLKVITEKEAEIPSREIKRGEFIHWLLKGKKTKLISKGHEFKDVPIGYIYHKEIVTAAELGIIDKTEEFRPDDPLIRAEASIWLVNAKGESAKKSASSFTEPLIPAQDGFYEVPKEAIGAFTTCILPENQLLYYRWKEGEDFRLIKPNAPMIVAEALHSIFMLLYPPKRGGTITVGMSMEPKTLFAGLEQTAAFSQISPLLYNDTIGGRDENWSLFPVMIKRIPTQENGLWKVLDDGRMEVTFEFHKGLKWADGQEITADDALFSYLFTNHPSFPTIHNESDFWLDKVEVKDPYTAVAYWNQHYTFANLALGVFPRHYFEKEINYHLDTYNLNDKKYYDPSADNPNTKEKDESYKSEKFLSDEQFITKATQSDSANYDYIKNPMHAGPYKVKKWEQGQSIILEPNENYMYGKPLLDSFIFRTIENTDTLLAAALAGNVDMTLSGLTFDQAIQLNKKTNIPQKAFFVPSLMWAHLDLNIDDPILSDIRVRKALLHGIDRQGISTQMFEGIQPVADSWLPPKHPAYNDKTIVKYAFDQKKAGELLDSAGWKLNPTKKVR
jgi:peptide/nickel transport system substrate-binding protein